MITPAQRMEVLTPHFFATLGTRIAALTEAGADIIRLDEGSPDMPPARFIIDALAEAAARPDAHSYQPHRGTQELRTAWASMYRRLYQVELDPASEVLPLLGSKEGLFHIMQAFINPGDLALVPDPGYITYRRSVQFSGGEVYFYPLLPERGYLPDLAAIPPEIARRARVMFLNYPNNPTATVADLGFFNQAVGFARAHGLLLVHDAAYNQVTFNGYQAPSLLQIPGASDIAVEFNTLSKSHNMAGWRVGAALGQKEALNALFTLKTNADSGHFYPILYAATVAMTGDQSWLAERNEIYRRRMQAIVSSLNRIGLAAKASRGSLYVWSPILSGWRSDNFVVTVLEQAHVSFTPGTIFGQKGEGYMRISFTASLERIEEAMQRLEHFMDSIS